MLFSQQQTGDGLCFFTSDLLSGAGGTVHGFSTRSGGVSQGDFASLNLSVSRGDQPQAVGENHRRFSAAVGARLEALVFSRQVHGDNVRTVTTADCGKGLLIPCDFDADGLITDIPGIPLMVFGADCIPVLLYDPVRRVAGAVHAGWRGTTLKIAGKAARQMQSQFGCRGADILAAIGPGISKCCFETHEDVPNAMLEAFGPVAFPYLESVSGGNFRVDLKGLNALSHTQAGLTAEHISVSDLCTVCRPELFWSHRRDGEQRGTMGALIQMT